MVKKRVKISTLGSRITSIVSVSLVLYIIGLLAGLAIVTHRLTDALLGNVSIIVKIDPMASEAEIEEIGAILNQEPWAAECLYTSAQEVLKQEMEFHAEALAILDENPYSPEYEVRLTPAYVNGDSISAITNELSLRPGIEDVVSQVEMVRSVNTATTRVALGLACVAGVLLIISLVLIFNTVSISVYGRRFVIHTMQLVGATASFIRRPFVRAGMLAGLLSAIIATVGLVLTASYVTTLNLELNLTLHWIEIALISAGLFILGLAICGLSALMATNKYLTQSVDNLYT